MARTFSAYAAAYGYTALRQQVLDDGGIWERDPAEHFVEVLDVSSSGSNCKKYTTAGELDEKLQQGRDVQDSLQIVLLHQDGSHQPINAGQDMVALLLDHFEVMPEFLEVISNFRFRKQSTEEGYSSPFRFRRTSDYLELTYVYKYGEFKSEAARPPYVIRQTAIWHRYTLANKSSVAIVLSPNDDSIYPEGLKGSLLDEESRSHYMGNPLQLHAKLISTYLHEWKPYLLHYENEIWTESKTAMNIDANPKAISPTLQKIHQIRRYLIPVETILSSTEVLCGQLRDIDKEISSQSPVNTRAQLDSGISVFTSFVLEAGAFRRNVGFLTRRASQVSQLISDTLNLRNQRLARADSVTIRVITFITLVYLPFSFIASLLGSNLINFDTESRNIVVSNQFWIFFAISLPLTGLTICGWWVWVTWRNRVEQGHKRRLAFKSWSMKINRLLRRNRKGSIEMSLV